jgi:superfamily I DNA/RNA helicase
MQGRWPLSDFLGHICLESYVKEPAKVKGAKKQQQVQRADALTISTIHAAKGLEYDTVWVVRWVEGFLPAHLRNEEGQLEKDPLAHEEEETRLAHVVSASLL